MRLVDENEVIEVLKQTGIIQDNDLGHCVIAEINKIPTAYDVDAVERRLKSQKEVWNDKEVSDARLVEEKRKAYDMAIKIVKGGYTDGNSKLHDNGR